MDPDLAASIGDSKRRVMIAEKREDKQAKQSEKRQETRSEAEGKQPARAGPGRQARAPKADRLKSLARPSRTCLP